MAYMSQEKKKDYFAARTALAALSTLDSTGEKA